MLALMLQVLSSDTRVEGGNGFVVSRLGLSESALVHACNQVYVKP